MTTRFPVKPLLALSTAAIFSGLLLTASLLAATVAEGTITTRSLLAEMTDLRRMAEFPAPEYTTRQFASYDRRSTAPGNASWFANDDWGQFLRVEERERRKEQVMMDARGPGAVVRIWSANPSGTLRIYVDGQPQPVLEGKMEDLLGGKVRELPSPLAGIRARGYNLYFPIPYARSCKITCDEGKPYYQVDYRTYTSNAKVQSFTAPELQTAREDIFATAARLADPERAGMPPDKTDKYRLTLAPGASASLAKIRGPRAICQLLVRPEAKDVAAALRGVVARISFDGEQTVEAPLGDFFGAAPGLNTYATLPVGGTDHGTLWSHWVMPFRREAEVRLVNLGEAPVTLQGEIGTAPYRWSANSMHFSAGYIARNDLKTRPMSDLTHLQVEGKGVFAGISLAVDNPVRAWWGEGDEKIYVDGESFPSFFGTGTEDYFGYAWCDTAKFSHAYHSQPRTQSGPGNYGTYSNNRFHIMDRIPFNRKLKFDMELWHWEDRVINLATVAYWYAAPGARSGFAPLKAADLVVRSVLPYQPVKVAGALEGEAMEVVRQTGAAGPQPWADLSGDAQLWWRNTPKPGDTLVLRFQVPADGRYRVFGRFLKARDYGVHQLAINGQNAGAPIDFYNPEVVPTDELELGAFALKVGANELSVTVTGANERADKGYMFGLDYLLLKPAVR